jgi:hypothetical protein
MVYCIVRPLGSQEKLGLRLHQASSVVDILFENPR